ncbi:hypothetical protein [Tabrizicola sp.]|uniref:hypothetical protein n=1 Tax=Tabrizicola sp. TaxID=2005166 RepID=UPI003F3EE021
MTFEHYRHALLDSKNVYDPRLLMAREGALEVRYAPFDHVNPNAKLVILGITPGEQQADAAIVEVGRALRSGASDADALARAKAHASFAGPMRANLVAMLDAIGVNSALGIASCNSLWSQDVGLVQFASALRYPVFKGGKNYTGSSPKIAASALLREHLLNYTASELESLPKALVIPLGPAVLEACRYLERQGTLDARRVIEGVPHPSGANGERVAYFLGRKEIGALSEKTDPHKIDTGRITAEKTVEKWQTTVR